MYESLHLISNQQGTSDPDPEPRKHYEVHCGQCRWWGMLEQLKTIYKSNPAEPEDILCEPACPMCLSDQWLEYKEELQETIAYLEEAIQVMPECLEEEAKKQERERIKALLDKLTVIDDEEIIAIRKNVELPMVTSLLQMLGFANTVGGKTAEAQLQDTKKQLLDLMEE